MSKFDPFAQKKILEAKRKANNPGYYDMDTVGVKITKSLVVFIGAAMFYSFAYSFGLSSSFTYTLYAVITGIALFFLYRYWGKRK